MPLTNSVRFVDSIIIDTSNLTATADDVVTGKMYIGKNKKLESGSLPLIEEDKCVDTTLLGGTSYQVPYGKISKSFIITAQDIGSQTVGTAIAEDILINKTAWVNGTKLVGTMVDNGAVTAQLAAGKTYTVPAGYHNGSGVITAQDLASQTIATAEAEHILIGRTAWVNGVLIAGSMDNRGSMSQTLDCGMTFTIPRGYHDGTGVITAKALDLQTEGTALDTDILYGKTAWVNGVKLTGNIPLIAAATDVLPLNGTYVIPKGYHGGLGQITQNVPTMSGFTVTPAAESQTLEVAGHYMTGNIEVTGIDALNYQRPYDTPIIPLTALVFDSGIATAKLTVDNWHDNATMNVYKVILTDLTDSTGYKIAVCEGTVVYDWDGSSECTDYETTISGTNIKVAFSLESGTNAHTFTVSSTTNTFVSGYIKVVEIFSSRQYGVDYT